MDFVDKAPLSLDRDRVTCLLLINTHLMKKCSNMYTNVICNQSLMQQMSNENRANITQSYANYIKRLQCNLTTLNYIYEKYHGSQQQQQQASRSTFPVVLSAPPDMPELFPLYAKLQELYAEALQYLRMKMDEMRKQQMFQQQKQQQMQPQQSGGGGMSQFQQPPLPSQQQQQQQQQQPNSMHLQQQQVPTQSQLNMQQQSQPMRQPQMQPYQQQQQQHAQPRLHPQMQQQQQPPQPPTQQPQQQQQQPPLSATNSQFQQPFDDMLLADTFTNPSSRAPSGMSMNTTGVGVDFTNQNFSNGGVMMGNGINNSALNSGLNSGGNSFQMSTLSPQQILQQANEAKSNTSDNNNGNTPHLDSNEFGIF
ncbi:hypothetical protein CANMA_004269 [Candida margitis]|uniref:uncharacterized protein n=1 Tax=Candida margitis TaxID=1775924 RepID=UPI0022277238|nr:uncharacterized protein CANMA_004269 [Candida margitis]KAI5958425.1 hypothetical protein CANMA_004269 [Candida margitis]